MPLLQETMDVFIRRAAGDLCISPLHAEQCMDALTTYLLHFSDLFDDQEPPEEDEYSDWEAGLDAHMSSLLQGDVESAGDLGQLPLARLDPEHVRDFLGWFLLRETGDIELIETHANTMRVWVEFVHASDWWPQDVYLAFKDILDDITPEAVRVVRLSQVLFHFVRSGTGVPPRLRGQRFSHFVEGHGRVSEIADGGLYLNFDNQGEKVGPVLLPGPILALIATGDVFDIELGLRGDSWVIVDIGPVYPSCVYIDVEEYQGLEKIS